MMKLLISGHTCEENPTDLIAVMIGLLLYQLGYRDMANNAVGSLLGVISEFISLTN